MDNYACPKCGETERLLVGNFPLQCGACGWHYLNEYPCRMCGKPARSCCGWNGQSLYGCAIHPITEDEFNRMVVGTADMTWLPHRQPLSDEARKILNDDTDPAGGFVVPIVFDDVIINLSLIHI